MQATRKEILELLKKKSKATVKELSIALGLTPTGVRQHLVVLERDALVATTEVRGQVGRPYFVYALTEEAEDLFPKAYDLLADWLLDEIKAWDGTEKLALYLDRLAEHLAQPYLTQMDGKSLPQRVKAVASIFAERGDLADWEEKDGHYLFKRYACIYHRLAQHHRELCSLDLGLLHRLLGVPVVLESTLWDTNSFCAFLIAQS
ncbi:MAG: winged helix-turn-helix transcriptional regulator [Chloroflexi bacterium]|nr:winged helix-turn-helix transcriptional regulator [Chloroflexota bacterium]